MDNTDKNDIFSVPPERVEILRKGLRIDRKETARSFGITEKELSEKLSACVKWIFGAYDWYFIGSKWLWDAMKVRQLNTVSGQPDPKILKWLCGAFSVLLFANKTKELRARRPRGAERLDSWLSEKKSEIEAAMENGPVMVVSNTGTGKTELVKDMISSGKKMFVIVPNLSHLRLYAGYAETVDRETPDIEFLPDKSYVMVWDQFVRRTARRPVPDNHILIIDESHQTFTDRSFRRTAAEVTDIAKKLGNRVLLLTATDTREAETFGVKTVLRYYKERETVKLFWTDTDNPYRAIRDIIAGSPDRRVAVLSDRHAVALWEDDCGSALLSAKFAGDEVTYRDEALEGERLTRRHTYMTKYVCTGINLRNEDKILLVIESNRENDWSYIAQAIGRFRNAAPDVVIVNDIKGADVYGFRDPVARGAEYTAPDEYINYIKEESDRESKIERLLETGYIGVTDLGYMITVADLDKSENPLKRRASDRIRDMVEQGEWDLIDETVSRAASNPTAADPYIKEYTERLTEARRNIPDGTITAFTKLSTYGNRKLMDAVLLEMGYIRGLLGLNPRAAEWIRTDPDGYVRNIGGYVGMDAAAYRSMTKRHREYSRLLNMITPTGDGDVFDADLIGKAYDFEVKKTSERNSKKITLIYTGPPEDWTGPETEEFAKKSDMESRLKHLGFKQKDIQEFRKGRGPLTRLFKIKQT